MLDAEQKDKCTCRETCWFVTLREVNREVCDKSLNVVVSTAIQTEWRRKSYFIQCNCIHINFLQENILQ